MPKRLPVNGVSAAEACRPQRKKRSIENSLNLINLKQGKKIVDNIGNKWKLGKAIGTGGFGEIYNVFNTNLPKKNQLKTGYVAKIEKHSSGPLFVEINCYLRMSKAEMIEEWKSAKNLKFLGVPHFVASGSFMDDEKNEKYRFLILPKFKKDLDCILQKKKFFNLKTVLVIASRIIDILEYIHSKGYIHCDIKASNILLGYCSSSSYGKNTENTESELLLDGSRNNTDFYGDNLYLLDYGLASKYLLSSSNIKECATDERKAHAGTILFCSRDAHKGIISRRSDLECLAYNMIYWLTGCLPWSVYLNQPELVDHMKNKFFKDIDNFLLTCFKKPPKFLIYLYEYIENLQFQDVPDYDYLRNLFNTALKEKIKYNVENKLNASVIEDLGKIIKNRATNANDTNFGDLLRQDEIAPLSSINSNTASSSKRSKLRTKSRGKLKTDSAMNWSKILHPNPELIIKQAHHNKIIENPNKITNILRANFFEKLNPTPTMRDVYKKVYHHHHHQKINDNSNEKRLDLIEGYNAEMMKIYRLISKSKFNNVLKKDKNKQINKRG